MRFNERLPAGVLLAAGLALVAGNLWFTAARSTIPLALDARVVGKQMRTEKHERIDAVYLLTLKTGRRLQVDREVFEAIDPVDEPALQKRTGETALRIVGRSGERTQALRWSDDARGMLPTMGAAILALFGLAWPMLSRRPLA